MDSAILNTHTHLQLCLHPTGCLPEDGQRVECYEHWCTKVAPTTLSPHHSHVLSIFTLCIFLLDVSWMQFVKSSEEIIFSVLKAMKRMTVSKHVSWTLPSSAIGWQSNDHGKNSHYWLSRCCYDRKLKWTTCFWGNPHLQSLF